MPNDFLTGGEINPGKNPPSYSVKSQQKKLTYGYVNFSLEVNSSLTY